LADEPTSAGADRRTNRKLAQPPSSARHHQSGNIRARNQQDRKDETKENPRDRPRILHLAIAQRPDAETSFLYR